MDKVWSPANLNELWNIVETNPDAEIYAGGTDLLVRLRQNCQPMPFLICLERIPELRGIGESGEDIFINSGTSFNDILGSPVIARNFPVLIKALRMLGSPQIRNMGTIGGNVCTASPAGDSLPPFYVLSANIEIISRNSISRVPVKKFILGPGRTILRKGEIISRIYIKKCAEYNYHHYEKVGQRNALAIAIVSLAAIFQIDSSGIIKKARLAWGSVGPTVVESDNINEAFSGKRFSNELFEDVRPLINEAVHPISDIRAGDNYRRKVSGNLLRRLLEYR